VQSRVGEFGRTAKNGSVKVPSLNAKKGKKQSKKPQATKSKYDPPVNVLQKKKQRKMGDRSIEKRGKGGVRV